VGNPRELYAAAVNMENGKSMAVDSMLTVGWLGSCSAYKQGHKSGRW